MAGARENSCHICSNEFFCFAVSNSSFVCSSQKANIFKKYLIERNVFHVNTLVSNDETEVSVCLKCHTSIKELLQLHSTLENIRQEIQTLLDSYIEYIYPYGKLSTCADVNAEIKKEEEEESDSVDSNSPSWEHDEDESNKEVGFTSSESEQDAFADSVKESNNNPEASSIIQHSQGKELKVERLPEVNNEAGHSLNSKLTANKPMAETSIGFYADGKSSDSEDNENDPTTFIIQKEYSDYFVMLNPQSGQATIKCKCCDKIFKNPNLYFVHRGLQLGEDKKDGDNDYSADRQISNIQLRSNRLESKSTSKSHIKNILQDERQLECTECRMSFTSNQALSRHLKRKCGSCRSEGGAFKCPECPKAYNSITQLDRHRTDKHNYVKLKHYLCFFCQLTFMDKNDLDLHIYKDHMEDSRFKCPHCPLTYTLRYSLQCHIKYKHAESLQNEIEEGDFVCQVCEEHFKAKPHLKLHLKEIHYIDSVERKSGANPRSKSTLNFVCTACGRAYKTELRLQAHQLTHKVGELPHKCVFCAKTFKEKQNLQEHYLTHKEEMTFLCSPCTKHFKSSADLIAHQLSEEHIGDPPYKCSSCPMTCEKKEEILDHLQSHKGDKEYLCSLCGKGFDYYYALQSHSVTHNKERPYKCSSCPRTFKNNASLICHIEHAHMPKQRIKCPHCTKIMSSKGSLTAHIAGKHSNSERLKCSLCTSTFSARRYLQLHVKTVHLKIKPHKCTLCAMKFSQKQDLKAHFRTHTDEKPYLCTTCGKRFRSSEHLKMHEVIHTGKKPFKCPYCEYACANRPNIYTHMKKQHAAQRSEQFNYNEWLSMSK